ncbi:MAG: cation diffusion facilitator family transporter [Paludibacter sp.]|jgi:cobalt-zinc-cadmium efflux system protein|nr:cation diffusion facilitator family transporter [Paludibacter sp.]
MSLHHHHSTPDHPVSGTKNIRFAFFLNLGFTLIEIAGGLLTNSVAILSDALHDFGDSISLGLAWYFQKLSVKGSNEKYSYGYKRFSLIGALANSLILVIGSIFILSETIPRLLNPQPANEVGMFWLAILGILVNGAAVIRLKKGTSLNEKVVSLHLLEDVLGWAAILVGSVLMYFFNLPFIDPLLSIMISIYILSNVAQSIREGMRILLQATPDDIRLQDIRQRLLNHPLIEDVHDLHVWSADGSYHVMTMHVVLKKDTTGIPELKTEIRTILKEEKIEHATIEFENSEEACLFENCTQS